MRTVIDNVQIHFTQEGSDTGQPLILLHGWGTDVRTWVPLKPALLNAGFQLFALDMPGFGLSPAPSEAWGIPEYTNLTQQFVQKKQIERPVLVGHSFGGRISILLAAQHPELVSKVILINSAGIRIEPSGLKKFVGQIGSSISSLTKNSPASKLVQPLRRQYYSLIGAEDYINASDDMRETFVKVVMQDLREEAALIQAPTLLIWGTNDTDTPLWTGQLLQETIPHAELITLSDVGHFAHIEQPQVVADHIRKFIGTTPNGA